MPRSAHEDIDEIYSMFFDASGKFLGPKITEGFNFRLTLDEAEMISARLSRNGFDVRPYDFPRTLNIWCDECTYSDEIFRRGLGIVAAKYGVDLYNDRQGISLETMKSVLPYISQDELETTVINQWGTTCRSALKHFDRSPSAPILGLIERDPDFHLFRMEGEYPLKEYDFSNAPQNIWKDAQGYPTDTSREVTKLLLLSLARDKETDLYEADNDGPYIHPEKLRPIIPYAKADAFRNYPINCWETTIEFVLKMHGNSPSAALKDLINNDPEMRYVRNYALVAERKRMYLQ